MEQTTHHPTPRVQPTPQDVAQWIGGTLHDAEQAPERLAGLATLDEAGPDRIGFISEEKYLQSAGESRAGLLIVPSGCDLPGRARIEVVAIWPAVAELMRRLYAPPAPAPGVHPTAVVADDVKLGADVSVGPCCVVAEGCELGDGVILGPHCILDAGCRVGRDTRLVARVTLMGPVQLGERVIIHPGAVLGADGFKFEPADGVPLKIPQVGTVIVEDDVEIGANTTIDRAFLHDTRIGRHTKLDNLVQIAHNCQIGPGCLMAAHVGISGSCHLGAGCLLGGRAGLRDGLTIGDGSMIGAAAGVHTDWPAGSAIIGIPAMPMKEFWRIAASQKRLPEYAKRLRALEQAFEKRQPSSSDDREDPTRD